MTGPQRLRAILEGGSPDYPPHWELLFDIEEEFFGMEPGEEETIPAGWARKFRVYERLVEEYDWAAVPGGYDPEQLGLGKSMIGDRALVAGYEGDGVFWMPSGGDIMDFVVRLFEKPDELHAQAREKCERAKQSLVRLADRGADFFVLTYDFGFNDAPFVSPVHFSEFVAPYLSEIVEKAHDLRMTAILHSDGCLSEILDQIYATGVDGYQSVDPQGHMDIREVRRDYPDWILMGNVACNMLQETDEEKIRDSVTYCMEHGGIGHRYIFSTSNCIFAGMPSESYRIMLDEYASRRPG